MVPVVPVASCGGEVVRPGKKYQRGYYMTGPTTGELVGCLGIVALFFICAGVGLAVIAPKVWAWLKPILQGWLA